MGHEHPVIGDTAYRTAAMRLARQIQVHFAGGAQGRVTSRRPAATGDADRTSRASRKRRRGAAGHEPSLAGPRLRGPISRKRRKRLRSRRARCAHLDERGARLERPVRAVGLAAVVRVLVRVPGRAPGPTFFGCARGLGLGDTLTPRARRLEAACFACLRSTCGDAALRGSRASAALVARPLFGDAARGLRFPCPVS
jgi:hypothetical protein